LTKAIPHHKKPRRSNVDAAATAISTITFKIPRILALLRSPWKKHWGTNTNQPTKYDNILPSGYVKIAIENGHL